MCLSVAGPHGGEVSISRGAVIPAYDHRYGECDPRKHSGSRCHGDLSAATGNRGTRGENRGGFQNVSAPWVTVRCLITDFLPCMRGIRFLGGEGTHCKIGLTFFVFVISLSNSQSYHSKSQWDQICIIRSVTLWCKLVFHNFFWLL